MEPNHALTIVRGRRQTCRERWARIVGDWNRSGLSGVAFAAEQGIDVRGLYRWRRLAEQKPLIPASPGLIEVPPVTISAWAAEVAIRGGTVRLSPAASPQWAGLLIKELSQC